MSRKRRAVWLLLAAGTTALDLWSKALWRYPLLKTDPPGEPQRVVLEDWVYVRTIWNEGAVWSIRILHADLLTALTAVAVPLLLAWLFWPRTAPAVDSAGKALVLGGAAGNLYDRSRWGAVRDFIDVCFGDAEGYHWPTFNVADAALVVGIGLLVLFGLRKRQAAPEAAA